MQSAKKNSDEYHEAANLLPMMSPDEYRALKKDIKASGLLEPIMLHQGKILDGRNRYKACIALGVEPKYKKWQSQDGQTEVEYVYSKNLARRHLTESQRAMCAADLATYKIGRPELNAQICGLKQSKAAKLLQVSPRNLQNAKAVKTKGTDELNQQVRQGKVAVSTAAQIATLPKDEQKKITSLSDRKAIVKATKQARERVDVKLGPPQEVMDVIWPTVMMLSRVNEHLDGRDPKQVAEEFFKAFPFYHKQITARFEDNIGAARLLIELHKQWRARRVSKV